MKEAFSSISTSSQRSRGGRLQRSCRVVGLSSSAPLLGHRHKGGVGQAGVQRLPTPLAGSFLEVKALGRWKEKTACVGAAR